MTAHRRGDQQSGPGEVFGTHRYPPMRIAAWTGIAVLAVATVFALTLAVIGQAAWSGVGLGAATGVGPSVFLWGMFARPRLVVEESGITVVNPLRSTRLTWAQIDHFDCQQHLLVYRTNGSVTTVEALPAPGLRRILRGTPGQADLLASRLNQHLTATTGDGSPPCPVSIQTPEGRHDIRVLAALGTAAMLAIALFRLLLAPHL